MKSTTASPRVADAFENFDNLPAAANVRVPVVAAVYGVSKPTVWRWVKAGLLPAPTRRGGVTTWSVGTIRADLAARRP
jgi:predicted DNA-binding transcriptional regulator AlpA